MDLDMTVFQIRPCLHSLNDKGAKVLNTVAEL